MKRRRFYVPVAAKLAITLTLALGWLALSVWLARPWIADLGAILTPAGAWLIVTGVAFLPGFASAFVLVALVLDRRPQYATRKSLPPVSILVAAYNEAQAIRETLESIVAQAYPGEVETLVIDDGSTDRTAGIVRDFIGARGRRGGHHVTLVQAGRNGGKANALNLGLKRASHALIVTVDADTLLYPQALARLVTHLIDGPAHTAAVAGTVLVRNSRRNLMTKLQEWDYFHGIAIVKRTQSLFQGTLVAQGAFSAYKRKALEDVGGWPQTVGEDIVLTWGMLCAGYRVGYAENAFVFTNVPESFGAFYRQRKRWARGLIEAFKRYPGIALRWKAYSPFIFFNLCFPYIDFMYLFVFVPGVIAALFFQWYALVGLLTLLLLPLALLCNVVMYLRQRAIFVRNGLKVRRNIGGLLTYCVGYQLFLSPASLAGYATEFLGRRKTW